MPSGATLTARAPNIRASRAGPPSPPCSAMPVPAKVSMMPLARSTTLHTVVGDIGDIEVLLVGVEGEPVRLGEPRL